LRVFRRALYSVLLVLAVGISLYFVPTPYFLVMPGSVRDLGESITVEGGHKRERGQMLMTTIITREASALLVVYGALHPGVDLRHREEFLRPGEDVDEYVERMKQMMSDSQGLAAVAALKYLGLEAQVKGEGARVAEVLSGSVRGTIEVGDIIVGIDGRRVEFPGDLRRYLETRRPGDSVFLRLRRGPREVTVKLEVGAPPPGRSGASLGLYVEPAGLVFDVPLDISIEVGNTTGPSAGLMFALEIIDQLTPEELTGGYRVAGTGTIDERGNVGPIGGIRLKVLTVEAAGVDYFLVPAANQSEAEAAARRVAIVPVATLEDAVTYLREELP